MITRLNEPEPGPDDVPLPLAPATGPMPKPPALPRRTKRRFAHELYPHGQEFETRPLAVEVPYLYARMIGMDVRGTSWFDMRGGDAAAISGQRMERYIAARQIAMLADAILQGMAGDEAWAWAERGMWDYDGEIAYARALHYGVPVEQIKPYPCGPEPDHHDHHGEPDVNGWRTVHRIDGKESECLDCTEEIPTPGPGECPLPIAEIAE